VNEQQSWDRVQAELVEPVRSSLELFAATREGASLADFQEMLFAELEREPCSRLANPANLWNRPDNCNANGIPLDAWHRLLSIGFQAITHLKGFSYCESDRDTFGGDIGAPTLNILGALEEVSAEVAEALTQAQAGPGPSADDMEVSGVAEDVDEEVFDVTPLTDSVVQDLTSEISSEFEEEIQALREQLIRSERARDSLEVAWNKIYEAVVGLPDKEELPTDPTDPRIGLMVATVEESIECITQVFKGIARFGGDELGENVPKIRKLIQDAIFDKEGDPEKKEKKIKRQMRALRMFLFATVQTFLEAHSHSTKLGTQSLLRLLEKGLFEPVVKGKRSREPDAEEIKRRYQQLAGSIPDKHHRVFQPFFQEYVRQKLTNLK
jgi:hypothetical protein